eukprot:TRINITY_DN2985_c0_g1_i2.p1 TRINITY_DN2985_c0_g1~~TRINITY_DN2985_c0_g1_i2.p1  ORF type:complete len:352 (-),score=95.97 TRINITY_DN2985_c0_g1_i2:24-968(-)
MAEQHSVRNLLASVAIKEIATAKGELVVVKSSQNPYEGFKTLVDHNILSAPVLDEKTGKYTGFLDIKDLVSFVVFVDDDQKSDVPQNLGELIIHGCKLFKVDLDGVTVTYLSRRNPFRPIKSTDSLLKVCEELASGLHRVPIVDDAGNLVNIISQSAIVSWLYSKSHDLKHFTSKSIEELNLGTKPVIMVKENTPAIETFRLMDNKKISGVAVVDSNGKFVGNTSASDLKLFMKTLSLEMMHKPTIQFLKTIRQESVDIKSPTISCSPHDTLHMALGKLCQTKVHKLFIADDAKGFVPHAVLSITDILRYFLKH